MNQTTLSLDTPSKINIFLRIIGKMPNGYNEIETVFLPLQDIFDKITVDFSSKNGILITSENISIPLNPDNICYKAAEAYSKETGITPTWNIKIEKNIPIAAGMGGGSSDAAAVLLLLQKFYNNTLSDKKLHSIALQLGADVPYFLNPVPAIGRGVGEKLEPIPMTSGLHIVILAPQFPVSATWAYKNYIQPQPSCSYPNIIDLLDCLEYANWQKLGELIHNDLAIALYKKFPALKILKEDLIEAGAFNAAITGSGPTLFGITNSRQRSECIAKSVAKKYSGTIKSFFTSI